MLERKEICGRNAVRARHTSTAAAQRTRRSLLCCARISRSAKYLPILCISLVPGLCRANTLELGAFNDLAHRCGSTVAAATLAAVAKTESGFETLAVSDNTTGRSHTYQTLEEAAPAVERFITNGDSVDIGLMQINSANLKRLGMTVRDALDSCKSISGAASILTSNYLNTRNAPTQQIALRDAISEYNTGNRTDGYRNGYVRRVERAASTLLPAPGTDVADNGTLGDGASHGGGDNPTSEAWDVWNPDGHPSEPDTTTTTTKPDIDVF